MMIGRCVRATTRNKCTCVTHTRQVVGEIRFHSVGKPTIELCSLHQDSRRRHRCCWRNRTLSLSLPLARCIWRASPIEVNDAGWLAGAPRYLFPLLRLFCASLASGALAKREIEPQRCLLSGGASAHTIAERLRPDNGNDLAPGRPVVAVDSFSREC